MLNNDPTYVGSVDSVTGSSIRVTLAPSIASGFSIIEGRTYKIGQVGSFVRIPQGYQSLFGLVSEVGSSEPASENEAGILSTGRWMRISLVGETIGGSFERGISQYPNIGDSVHIATEDSLEQVYGTQRSGQINVGTLSAAESIAATLSLDALVSKHSTVLGSTGSGKSTMVASLIRSIVEAPDGSDNLPGARILMLDIHGEYSSALKDIANVMSIQPAEDEAQLLIPYWALNVSDLLKFLTGGVSGLQETAFIENVFSAKMESAVANVYPGVDTESMTLDTPVPFSIKKVWFDLISEETATYKAKDFLEKDIQTPGNQETLLPPTYFPPGTGSAAPFKNPKPANITRQLENMRSRLLDKRYDFFLHPGDWKPNSSGDVTKDLDSLLEGWLGGSKPITILDLSAVPSSVLELLIGTILKIIYDALYWGRGKQEGGVERPLLVVMEEAHRYLSGKDSNHALAITQRIAKEGRKYGVGCMIVSQRPSEVDETILSQCSTYFALRLTNPSDRSRVKGTLPDGLAALLEVLPVLRTGESLIMGEAAKLPMRCRITLPALEHQPKSKNPPVFDSWSKIPGNSDFAAIVAAWRNQNATYEKPETDD